MAIVSFLSWSLAEGIAQVGGIGYRRDAAVAQAVDAAGQARRLFSGRLEVRTVDADGGRSHELPVLRLRLGFDLDHLDLAGVETRGLHRLAQLVERPVPRGAPLPPQELDTRRPHCRRRGYPPEQVPQTSARIPV